MKRPVGKGYVIGGAIAVISGVANLFMGLTNLVSYVNQTPIMGMGVTLSGGMGSGVIAQLPPRLIAFFMMPYAVVIGAIVLATGLTMLMPRFNMTSWHGSAMLVYGALMLGGGGWMLAEVLRLGPYALVSPVMSSLMPIFGALMLASGFSMRRQRARQRRSKAF